MTTAVLLLALAAPVPKHRPLPPFSPLGEWRVLAWAESSGPAVFRKDGTMSYLWQGQRWDGEWQLRAGALDTWSWPASEVPEPGSRRDGSRHWPLAVEGRTPKAAWGPTRGGGRWRAER